MPSAQLRKNRVMERQVDPLFIQLVEHTSAIQIYRKILKDSW